MTLRLLYVFDRPLPSTETDAEQAMRTIAALTRRGVRVTLATPTFGDAPAPTRAELEAHYQVRGDFDVLGVPARRMPVDALRKAMHSVDVLTRDLVDGHDLLYTRNMTSLFAAAARGVPVVYETYRPWFEQFPVLRPAFRRSMSAHSFRGAVLHSRFARDRYARLGVAPERLLVAHNGYDPAAFTPPRSKLEARAILGLDRDARMLTYTGHVNATKGLDTVLGIARRVRRAKVLLVGAERDGLVARLAKAVPNVELVPWQPLDRVALYLQASDVLLQPPSSVPLRLVGNTVLPMKLFLYLAAGRPILAPSTPDVTELLTHDDNAWLVAPGDTDAAARGLERLLDDELLARRLGTRAAEFARGLTWDARAEKLDAFLRDVALRRER